MAWFCWHKWHVAKVLHRNRINIELYKAGAKLGDFPSFTLYVERCSKCGKLGPERRVSGTWTIAELNGYDEGDKREADTPN